MALTSREQANCPESGETRFATLGNVNRVGTAFCAAPYAPELLAGVQDYRAFRMQCLGTTFRILDACRPPAQSVVSVRLKRLDSIRRKITRRGANFRLGTLDDVIGVRVICQSVSDVIALSARIESSPHIYRIKNYIEASAATGYRGIHHIIRFDQPAGSGPLVDRALRNPSREPTSSTGGPSGPRPTARRRKSVKQTLFTMNNFEVSRWISPAGKRTTPHAPQDELLSLLGRPHHRRLLAALPAGRPRRCCTTMRSGPPWRG